MLAGIMVGRMAFLAAFLIRLSMISLVLSLLALNIGAEFLRIVLFCSIPYVELLKEESIFCVCGLWGKFKLLKLSLPFHDPTVSS